MASIYFPCKLFLQMQSQVFVILGSSKATPRQKLSISVFWTVWAKRSWGTLGLKRMMDFVFILESFEIGQKKMCTIFLRPNVEDKSQAAESRQWSTTGHHPHCQWSWEPGERVAIMLISYKLNASFSAWWLRLLTSLPSLISSEESEIRMWEISQKLSSNTFRWWADHWTIGQLTSPSQSWVRIPRQNQVLSSI